MKILDQEINYEVIDLEQGPYLVQLCETRHDIPRRCIHMLYMDAGTRRAKVFGILGSWFNRKNSMVMVM